jgi:hypothetical protein
MARSRLIRSTDNQITVERPTIDKFSKLLHTSFRRLSSVTNRQTGTTGIQNRVNEIKVVCDWSVIPVAGIEPLKVKRKAMIDKYFEHPQGGLR